MQISDRFKRYFSDFQKIGKKEKGIIIAILLTSFVVGIVGSVNYRKFTSRSPVTVPAKITPSPIPLPASLSLTSDKKEIKKGENITVTIKIDSPNQGVEAADFVVTFDPTYLQVATLSAGNYFKTYPVQQTEKTSVKFSGVASLSDNTLLIPKGEGTIGTILFQTIAATSSTEVKFDREKTIIATGGKNILDTNRISNVKVTIQ